MLTVARLVMPTPTTSEALAPAAASAAAAESVTVPTILLASICDQPACGLLVADCSSTWCDATGLSVTASYRMTRELEVPWSMDAMSDEAARAHRHRAAFEAGLDSVAASIREDEQKRADGSINKEF